MAEQLIGHVTHYFDHIQVAVIKLTDGALKNGDQLHITGKNDFQQTVSSMQVDHKAVESAAKGSEVAIKVEQHVKPKDQIFKITE
jgi:translation initiation factor IF-2